MSSQSNRAVVNNQPSYRKRHRIVRSCTECHRRKQKCDRLQPCQHCTDRGKPVGLLTQSPERVLTYEPQELCRYETKDNRHAQHSATNAGIAGSDESRIECPTTSHSSSTPDSDPLSPHDQTNLVTILGYSTYSAHNALSLFKQAGATPPSPSRRFSTLSSKQAVLDHKYRSLIAQLPPKEHVDTLIQRYFSHINWHYDVIDEITFRQQLENWRRIPYSAHSNATTVLSAEDLAFPSLLFQLMAHALIHQPLTDGTCSSLESLKYAPEMTFVDLACEFSEAGLLTMENMGKEKVTLVVVQTGILRASFLKDTGNVIEAWHVLGTAIRNAQEIGLHAELASQDSSTTTDAQWDKEMRRRIWFVLHNWDIHMAVVLGRPITTVLAAGSLPDDLAYRESGTSPRKRTVQDFPTPSSVIRVGYAVAYRYFPQIRDLENRGARTEDYNIVREMHAAISENMDRAPPWSCHIDTDGHFDNLPGCHWLPAARHALTSGIYFVLLSLHRPYIFSVAESRAEALKAALKILTIQRRLFDLSAPQQYISFNMVYPLFDAMVISLAMIVLFPNENLDIVSESIENVRWGVHMLSMIGEHVTIARAAHGIVKKLLSRLEQSGRNALQHSSHASPAVTEATATGPADPVRAKASSNRDFSVSNIDAGLMSLTYPQMDSRATNCPDFHFETLLPPQPVHDLFYQDICAPVIQDICHAPDFPIEDPEFDGHYPDNSFWSFMNNFGLSCESAEDIYNTTQIP